MEVLLLPDQVDSFWVTAGVDYEGKPFKSVTQGAADLSLIPLPKSDEAETPEPEAKGYGRLHRLREGDAGRSGGGCARLGPPHHLRRLPRGAGERHRRRLEKLLASAGRLGDAAKPVLEINPRHPLVAALAAHGASDSDFRADAAHLLLDQARVLDGDQPSDPQAFAERLMRVMQRGLPAA